MANGSTGDPRPQTTRSRRPPSGLVKLLLDLPVRLYRLGLGWLFGSRLVVLVHRGRRTGRLRRTALEPLQGAPIGEYRVLSGWGTTSDWYRNVQAGGAVALWVGRDRFEVRHRVLSDEEGVTAVATHVSAHPFVSRVLYRRLWLAVQRGEQSLAQELAGNPVVAFTVVRRLEAVDPLTALAATSESSVHTARLMAGGGLGLSPDQVGRLVDFDDGTRARIYRHTRRNQTPDAPVMLVVRFRLRFLGTNPCAHRAFQTESLLNTPLFAGQPGFLSKLWLADGNTGYYRGIYEWDGADRARRYGEILRIVLAPFVERDSFAYHVLPEIDRSTYLSGRVEAPGAGPAVSWWKPVLSPDAGWGP